MFVSDFLSRFSSDNNDEEPIPYLTNTSLLNNTSYMSQLDAIWKFNYNTGQDICTSHSFPITRSQANIQKIAIPSLFKPSTDRLGPAAKASILWDPPAVLTRKRTTSLTPLDVRRPEWLFANTLPSQTSQTKMYTAYTTGGCSTWTSAILW